MDTVGFLRTIWPEDGHYYIAHPRIDHDGSQKGFNHYGCSTVEEAANYVKRFVQEGKTVYHACASYTNKDGIIDENGKPRKRVAENAHKVQTFWIDLDCGAEKAAVGKGYATQLEAGIAVRSFCQQVGIELPLLVNSGHGLHAYWALDRALTPTQWTHIASMLRAVLDFYGVKHDSSRTTDIASILRPVGSINRKRDQEKEVQAAHIPMGKVPVVAFTTALNRVISSNGLTLQAPRTSRSTSNLNSDLTGGLDDYPESDLNRVADRCKQLGNFRDLQGMVEEPIWYAALGVIKFGTNADEVALDWSSGHPDFSESATLAKMEQWNRGPTTCARFAELNCEGCEGCVHRAAGKIKSPITLGWPDPEIVTEELVVDEDTGEKYIEVIPPIPTEFAHKYRWTAEGLMASVFDEETKEYIWKEISKMMFLPMEWGKDGAAGSADKEGRTDEHHTMRLNLRRRPGRWETFVMPTSLLGAHGKMSEYMLGKAVTGDVKLMRTYLTDWLSHLSNEVEQSNNYTRYGWFDGSFLCGDQMYTPDGKHHTVKLGGEALNKAFAFRPKGSLDQWVDIVDRAYNHPANIQYQYLLCAGFGAPLFPMIGGANIPAAMLSSFSPNSGYGKSTAQRFALSIFCNPKDVEMSAKNVTDTALYIYLGVYHNLPVMVDEITNVDGVKVSDLSYTISQGRPKERGTQSGGLRHNNHTWSTLVLTSGNRSLVSTLGAHKANAEAEIARIFECEFSDEVVHSKSEFDEISRIAEANYGTAAEPYLSYITANREQVQALLYRVQAILDNKVNAKRVERFWSATAAAVLTGGLIAHQLGLIKFDMAALMDWVCKQMLAQRRGMANNTQDDEETFATMMADFAAGLIVTDRDNGTSNKPVFVEVHPRHKPVGRVIVNEGLLFLSVTAVREWCSKYQADYSRIRRWLGDNGYIKLSDRQFAIGRGTQYPVPATKCWVLDAKKLNNGDVPMETKPNLTLHTGS